MKVKTNTITANEKRELERRIRADIAEQMKQYNKDIMAIVLWCLRDTYGFGSVRLHRFSDTFRIKLDELNDYYEMPREEEGFICEELLRRQHIEVNDYMTVNEAFVGHTFKVKGKSSDTNRA